MGQILVVKDWGATTNATKSIRVCSGVITLIVGAPAANQFLTLKPRKGVLYSALATNLAAASGSHIYNNRGLIGPVNKLTPTGMLCTDAGNWVMFQRFGKVFGTGVSKALLGSTSLECWASRIYTNIPAAAFVLSFYHKCGFWAFDIAIVTPWIVAAVVRIGRNLFVAQDGGTNILVYRAKGHAMVQGQTLASPVTIRKMTYDGKYLWIHNGTNLYQCSIRT